jgi:hypothetical protein
MLNWIRGWVQPVPSIPIWRFYLRCIWIAMQLIAVYCLANQVSPFFYQRF